MINDHLTSLGYRLEFTDDVHVVDPLLQACHLKALREADTADWQPARYLMACTAAGGTAASIGWGRCEDLAVVHSLAVAPTSRGSGVGAGLISSAMSELMEASPLRAIWLTTHSGSARRLFSSFGFVDAEADEVPDEVARHPAFADAREGARPMVRRYAPGTRRGLDHCAFRLVVNDTPEATLPLGSVFFFRQTGSVLEASYRGGEVLRGHLIGAIDDQSLQMCWHHYVTDGRLQQGVGHILVDELPDGRRELREALSGHESRPEELILREV